MSKPTHETIKEPIDVTQLPVVADDLPIMYEDEGQEEMGESTPHTGADHILSAALEEHFRGQGHTRVFSNLNLYYHPIDKRAYVSPDLMIIQPPQPLPERLGSYRIGPDRPGPVLVIEILSRRSFQQQDLTNKPILYAALGVAEYILVDGTGEFLPDRLLLRRLAEGEWHDEQDRDGGVTSCLGFRILIEDDELPRVVHTATQMRYLRPDEAALQAKERQRIQTALEQEQDAHGRTIQALRDQEEARGLAEQRIKDLEAELIRLRGLPAQE